MKNKMIMKVEDIALAGVYCMKVGEKILYVGSATEINDALSRHLYFLKRGLYEKTNKKILQKYYDLGLLEFDILWKSVFKRPEVLKMNVEEIESLQKELGILEEMYINLYKDTVCNKVLKVKKTSSYKNKYTSYNRHKSNRGSKNPNCKYNSKLIANIIWLKSNGYKPKKIVELIKEYEKIDINSTYISAIGVKKWIYTQAKKPDWLTEVC